MTAAPVRRLAPWAVLLLLTAVVATLLTTPRSGEWLSPRNNGPDGAQALARVLADQGVTVELIDGTRALDEHDPGAGTTVLLPHTAYLGEESGPALVATLRDVDQLVVLAPDARSDLGAALDLDLEVSTGSGIPVGPDCADPLFDEGDRVSGWDTLLSAGGAQRREVTACYPPGAGHNAGGAREGTLLSYPATADRPALVVAGLGSSWTNARITEEANAAVALRLLGGGERLLWVRPLPGDAGLDAANSLWDVLPRNLTAAVWVLAAAVLALALWQGRRLGAVVTEPLPAVVHASETTRSRGRLYRQAHDRGHALRAVQAGTRRRVAPLLGLARGATDEEVARAVARATGRPEHDVARLLVSGDVPTDDAALLAQVGGLRELEAELARPGRPVPPSGATAAGATGAGATGATAAEGDAGAAYPDQGTVAPAPRDGRSDDARSDERTP